MKRTVENKREREKRCRIRILSDWGNGKRCISRWNGRYVDSLTVSYGVASANEVALMYDPTSGDSAVNGINDVVLNVGKTVKEDLGEMISSKDAKKEEKHIMDFSDIEHAALRIRAQKPEEYFREKCDHVLENIGTQEEFHEKCLAFFRQFIIMK